MSVRNQNVTKKILVRTSLTKKADTSDILSASTMEALEELVVLNVDQIEARLSDEDDHLEDLPDLEDEVERDAHPDYVPAKAVPSTSTRGKRLLDRPQVQPKRSLNLVNNDTQAEAPSGTGKGRAMLRFGKYVNVSDRKAGALNEKRAVCIVDVGGVPCGKIIMQNGSSTTGLNQHLE